MARPRTFAEDKVLDLAMSVFLRRGYDGATMSDLTGTMRLTAPSIYAAFGSKQGLFVAVVARYSAILNAQLTPILAASTAVEVSRQLLAYAAREFSADRGRGGYLLVQAGLASAPDQGVIPDTLVRARRSIEVRISTRFEELKSLGDASVATDPAALASYVMAIFDGVAVKAASGQRAKDLAAIVEFALERLVRWPHAEAASSQRADRANGRGRPREFDAVGALDAAMEVFWRKGYEGTSLTDLTNAMGINRPSLYAAFGNKEALFLKALDRYQEVNLSYAADALCAPTALGVVKQLLAGAVAAQLSERRPRGCLWVVNSMQLSEDAKNIRAEVLRRSAQGHQLMLERFERAKRDGDLPSSLDPASLSQILGAVLQSIATVGGAGGSAEQLQTLSDSILRLWPKADAQPIDTNLA